MLGKTDSKYLKFIDVTLGYRTRLFGLSHSVILERINFELHNQLVLIGPNGCGKTTIIRACTGLLHPLKGQINFSGGSLSKSKITYLPQIAINFPWHKVEDEAAVLLEVQGVRRAKRIAKINTLLDEFSMGSESKKRIYQLSGGQKQKVAICRSLAAAEQADLLLLDEPTSFLDSDSRKHLISILPGFLKALTCPTVIATHDQELAGVIEGQKIDLTGFRHK